MDVGIRLIQLRETQGMTTNKLANKAGISQSYLREIELGKKNPTVEILSYLCDALKITLAQFFTEESNGIHPLLQSSLEKLNEPEQIKLAAFLSEIYNRR